MISADSLTFLKLDLLLIEMESSNSALVVYKLVLFFCFLVSQISCKPEASRATVAMRKGSSVEISNLRSFSSEIVLS